MILKKNGQKHIFFGESEGALRMGACRLVVGIIQIQFLSRESGFQSSCIGQYFWEQCSRGRGTSNGWTVRSYISRFHSDFFFSLVRDYTLLSHHVQLVAELPIIDAKRENYHRGNVTQKGAEGCGIA